MEHLGASIIHEHCEPKGLTLQHVLVADVLQTRNCLQTVCRRVVALLPHDVDLFAALRLILVKTLTVGANILLSPSGAPVRPLIELERSVTLNGQLYIGSIFSVLGDIPGVNEIAGLAGIAAWRPSRYALRVTECVHVVITACAVMVKILFEMSSRNLCSSISLNRSLETRHYLGAGFSS
jgi:hypothetical protein